MNFPDMLLESADAERCTKLCRTKVSQGVPHVGEVSVRPLAAAMAAAALGADRRALEEPMRDSNPNCGILESLISVGKGKSPKNEISRPN